MATIRRSKTMPTEGHATRFLYTILKQLDLKSIDWSLVATELDISNGHAARMRYSRFRQQMEGSTTTTTTTSTISKTAKPKKANGKTDSGKATKQSTKGKSIYDKGKNIDKTSGNCDNAKCDNSYSSDSNNLKKRPAPDGFMKQENKMNYGVMGQSEKMNNFTTPMMFDPFANAASYWTPSGGTILSSDPSTFPYMMPVPDLHHHQQQHQFPVDPFANLYLAPPMPPRATSGEDMNMTFNPGCWAPQSFDQMFNSNNQFGQQSHSKASSAPPAATTTTTATPSEWNNQMELCFSGCCQQPPPYPPTPSLYPDVPFIDQSGDSLMTAPPPEPWAPPPPPQQNHWVPIKPEPGEEGNPDDIFVKVETDA